MLIHYVQATLDGCSLVQCVLPAKYINRLDGHGATTSLGQETVEKDKFERADVIVLQRQIKNSVFQEVKKHRDNKLIVVDLDDDLWNLEPDNPLAMGWPPNKVHFLTLFIEQCSLITVHSVEVQKRLQERFPSKPVEYMPPIVDLDSVFITSHLSKDDGKVRVGWMGSSSHKSILDHIYHAHVGAMKRDPSIIGVWMGYFPDKGADIKQWWRYEVYDWVKREDFYQALGTLGLDVGLAPLRDNDFALTRSLRKIQDYGMFGIPTIVSDYGPFSTLPDDIVVKINPHNRITTWTNSILELVADSEKRALLSQNIREWTKQFDGTIQIPKWIDIYKKYL